MRTSEPDDFEEYAKYFSEESFWDKLSEVDMMAGRELIEKALVLYYCYETELVSYDIIKKIEGVLGYFIYPVDDIPDWIPGIGYSDDLEAILSLLQNISTRVPIEIYDKAQKKTEELFPKR